ncbi:hypothetical protein [Anabaena subtropica]|nr:hypothetical protein [Anabaena subtropica]
MNSYRVGNRRQHGIVFNRSSSSRIEANLDSGTSACGDRPV